SVGGSDDNYLLASGNTLSEGRNFSERELELGSNVAFIGAKIKESLFGNNEDPINKVITLGGMRFTVIGVLKSKGSSAAFGGDNRIVVPLAKARALLPASRHSYSINVMSCNPVLVDAAIGESTATFRKIRGLKAVDESNFEITKSDALVQTLMENL